MTVYPADSRGRVKIVSVAPSGATVTRYGDPDDVAGLFIGQKDKRESVLDRAVAMKAIGLTPQYAASIRAAAPWLKDLDDEELIEMKAVGVTPDYIRELTAAGFRSLDADDLVEARAVRLTAAYVRGMAAAGYRGSLDDYVEMRAVGVTPEYAASFAKRGIRIEDSDQLVEMRALNVQPDEVGAARPATPPAPPRSPGDG